MMTKQGCNVQTMKELIYVVEPGGPNSYLLHIEIIAVGGQAFPKEAEIRLKGGSRGQMHIMLQCCRGTVVQS